jgi:hypothetical protein
MPLVKTAVAKRVCTARWRHGDTVDPSSNGDIEADTAWLSGPISVRDVPREETQGQI